MMSLPAALTLPAFLALTAALNLAPLRLGVDAWLASAVMAALGGFSLAVGHGLARLLKREVPAEQALLLGIALALHMMALAGMALRWHPAWGLVVLLPLVVLGAPATRRPMAAGMGLVLLAVTAFTLAWTVEGSARFATFSQDGALRVWSDMLLHALSVAEQGDPRSVARLSGALADVAPPFYHFVSFALPGLFVRVLDMPPLTAAIGVWLPIGIALMTLALAALGRELAGAAGAALAIGLLAALPEGARYGLGHGFLAFHWLIDTAPGTGYGAAFGLLSLALLTRHLREGGWALLALSALAMAAVLLTRAHVFVWLAPAWMGTLVVASPIIPLRARWPLLLGGAVLALCGMLWMVLPEFGRDGPITVMSRYLGFLRQQDGGPGYMALARALHENLPAAMSLPALAILTQVGTSTGLVLAAFALGGLAALRRRLHPIDALPFLLLVWGGAVILLAPTPPHGDASEWRHRGFPVLVLVMMGWAAALLLRLWPRMAKPLPLAAIACFAALVTWQQAAAWKQPLPPWAATYRSTSVETSLRTAAPWLRSAVQPGQIFAMARPDPAATLVEPAVALAALSGVPSYVSRAGIFIKLGGRHGEAAAARLALLAEVETLDREPALARLREAGIAFYAVRDGAGPIWAAAPAPASYRADGLAIFATAATP